MAINNINNMMQFVNMIKNNQNPQEFIMGILEQRAQQNPMYKNLIGYIKNGDTQQTENFVRNVAKEKGIDFDKEFNSFKQMFKL